MGFLARLKRTEQPPDLRGVAAELERQLPESWRLLEFRSRLFGGRPVKLSTWGATIEGPGRRRVLIVSTDKPESAQDVLLDVVQGRAVTSRMWAPPPIKPWATGPYIGEFGLSESRAESAARREALDLLPAGATPMTLEMERFARVPVYAVLVQMINGSGIAGVGLTAVEAWGALAERLRGRLSATSVWLPSLDN